MKKNVKNKGFTVIEMLIYMAILAIFLTVLSEVVVSISQSRLESDSFFSVTDDGRFIIAKLEKDIKNAQGIINPGQIQESSESLILAFPEGNRAYSLENSNLMLSRLDGNWQVNGFDSIVSDLNFVRMGNVSGKNGIKINFTVTSKTQRAKGEESRNFGTFISIR